MQYIYLGYRTLYVCFEPWFVCNSSTDTRAPSFASEEANDHPFHRRATLLHLELTRRFELGSRGAPRAPCDALSNSPTGFHTINVNRYYLCTYYSYMYDWITLILFLFSERLLILNIVHYCLTFKFIFKV
jgi:hypothetical protein